MTNQERNMGTLVTCFLIALVALVPLRMIEYRNFTRDSVMVLGEEVYNNEEGYEEDFYVEEEEVNEDDETFLEDSEVYEEEMVLGEDDETFLEDSEVYEEEMVEKEIELPSSEIE